MISGDPYERQEPTEACSCCLKPWRCEDLEACDICSELCCPECWSCCVACERRACVECVKPVQGEPLCLLDRAVRLLAEVKS